MEKQYSVQFFSAFVEAIQKLCRDYLDFDQVVEIGGYLSVEIDNFKKERYVISEMLQQSGNTISESYCTKAFKTHSRCCAEKNTLRERHSNISEFQDKVLSTSDSQMCSQQTDDTQRHTHTAKRLRRSLLMTSSDAEVSVDFINRSGNDYNNEMYSGDYSPGKRHTSFLSTTERLRTAGAASSDCVGEKSAEEVRSRNHDSSVFGSPKSKIERLQVEEPSGSSSTHKNSAASFTETTYQHSPSDSVNKGCLGDSFSQPCSASSEEAVRLPVGTVVKDEPDNDNEDCVMVSSSGEDSNLVDSGDISYLIDPYQNSQQISGYGQSTTYPEMQMSSPADRPQVRRKTHAEIQKAYRERKKRTDVHYLEKERQRIAAYRHSTRHGQKKMHRTAGLPVLGTVENSNSQSQHKTTSGQSTAVESNSLQKLCTAVDIKPEMKIFNCI